MTPADWTLALYLAVWLALFIPLFLRDRPRALIFSLSCLAYSALRIFLGSWWLTEIAMNVIALFALPFLAIYFLRSPTRAELDAESLEREWSLRDPEWQQPHDNYKISFRPFRSDDLPEFIRWQQSPHAAAWRAARTEAVASGIMHILEIEGESAGYFEHRLTADSTRTALIDFLIGDARFLGRGLGSRAIRQYVATIVCSFHPDLERVIARPDAANVRCMRCLERAGFYRSDALTPPTTNKREQVCVLNLKTTTL